MAYHYKTWNKICNMRVKRMKAKLRRALNGKKEEDRLRLLSKVSLAYQDA